MLQRETDITVVMFYVEDGHLLQRETCTTVVMLYD